MLHMRTRWLYFGIACVSLCIGYLIYFSARPGPAIYAIPDYFQQWMAVQPLAAEFSLQLPSFFHSYAFILLTYLALGASSRFNLYLSIAAWSILEVLFETGQHALFKLSIINLIPGWFEHIPVLDLCSHYFLYGTFDPLDLLAIAIASIFALLTVRLAQGKEVHYD